MLISIDGPIGSGKTSLASLLSTVYPDSQDIPFSNPYLEKIEPNTKEIRRWTTAAMKGRTVFEKDSYNTHKLPTFSLLVHTARLKLIEANTDLQKKSHLFIETFFDPLWTFEKQHIEFYYPWLINLIKMPDVSLFLSMKCEKAFRRRKNNDGTKDLFTRAEFDEFNKKRNYFCGWGKKRIPNFHVINAEQPIKQVLEEAIEIINNVQHNYTLAEQKSQPQVLEEAIKITNNEQHNYALAEQKSQPSERITSLRQQSMRNTEL